LRGDGGKALGEEGFDGAVAIEDGLVENQDILIFAIQVELAGGVAGVACARVKAGNSAAQKAAAARPARVR
jgi:hypothetical protein